MESEEVVMNSDGVAMKWEGRISWNVEFLRGAGFLGGGVDDKSDGGTRWVKIIIVQRVENVPDEKAFGLEDKSADIGVKMPYSAPASPWYKRPLRSRKVNLAVSLSYAMRLNPSGRRSTSF